jgi:hypothetical protein
MKVLAKDAKAGQWYQDNDGVRFLCCDGRRLWTPEGETWNAYIDKELTHLPDCTGWDWQPPKPEKKYRPFANAAEFMPHRGRWIQHKEDRYFSTIATYNNKHVWMPSATTGMEYARVFSDFTFDDGTLFGVEVTE